MKFSFNHHKYEENLRKLKLKKRIINNFFILIPIFAMTDDYDFNILPFNKILRQ